MEVRHTLQRLFLLAAWTFCESEGTWKLTTTVVMCLIEMSQLRLQPRV